MKILVIYDSTHGNTEKVALAIGSQVKAVIKKVQDLKPSEVKGYEMIIVGSPTQGGRPTPAIQTFIDKLPALKEIKVAAFDTRFAIDEHGFGLKLVMAVINFAAPKIASALEKKGGELIGKEGFIVEETEGPLVKGELERAKVWAKEMLK